MEPIFFLKGLIIGFSIAAPVGPIGILCMRRTLAEGRLSGFVSGLGAATADAVYGSIAAFGLTFISGFLLNQQTYIRALGGLFLLLMGVRIFLGRHEEKEVSLSSNGLAGNYASTFFLTLTNPMTILSFVAIFAGLGIGARHDYPSAGILIGGVFLGSAFWWLLLSGGVGVFRRRFSAGSMNWVNRISGCVIMGFGVGAILSILL